MTQAIIVRFLGPTNTLQARVVATAWGKRRVETYSHAIIWEANACHAAMNAAEAWGWKGHWVAGCPDDGRSDTLVFVQTGRPDASFDLGE